MAVSLRFWNAPSNMDSGTAAVARALGCGRWDACRRADAVSGALPSIRPPCDLPRSSATLSQLKHLLRLQVLSFEVLGHADPVRRQSRRGRGRQRRARADRACRRRRRSHAPRDRRYLGGRVARPQVIWLRCACLTRTSRSGCTGQLGPASSAGLSVAPAHDSGWVAAPVWGAGRLRLMAHLASSPCVGARSGPAATPGRARPPTSTDRRSQPRRSRRARRHACAHSPGRTAWRGGLR